MGLPPGATIDPKEADRVIADKARIGAAYTYWSQALAAAGEDVLRSGTFGSEAMRFAAALPNQALNALVPETAHVFDAADPRFDRSGCLASSAEVATATGAGADANDLGAAIAAFAAAATQQQGAAAVSVQQAARGIRVTREVFDLVRRLNMCRDSATTVNAVFADVLGLFRQEGGLVLSPPHASYRHGPLIRTNANLANCRSSVINFAGVPQVVPTWGSVNERVGFNLSYVMAGAVDQPLQHPVSRSFGMVWRNIQVMAGLDSIFRPRLHASDELIWLFERAAALAPIKHLVNDVRPHLSAIQRDLLAGRANPPLRGGMPAGITMCVIDLLADDELPELEALLTDSVDLFDRLLAGHATVAHSGEVILSADETSSDATLTLELQARWWRSRTQLSTLLARRDRTGAVAFDDFTPFLAYLRFNAGDALFVGILLRTIAALDHARARAKKHAWPGSADFLDALDKSLFTASDTAEADMLVKTHWSQHVATETTWRHQGLVDAFRDRGVPPMWLTTPPAPPPTLQRTADVARRCVDLIAGADLMAALDRLLRTMPLGMLHAFGLTDGFNTPADGRVAFSKAHSFYRVRTAYANAVATAGLSAAFPRDPP